MIANYNFGFTPEYTLSIGFTLLTNMLAEYTHLMYNGDSEKDISHKKEINIQKGTVIEG